MGSFGLWFGNATNSAGRSWWNGFSRLESRRGTNAVVRKAADYQAFEQVLRDTLDQSPMRIRVRGDAQSLAPNVNNGLTMDLEIKIERGKRDRSAIGNMGKQKSRLT